MKNYKNNNKFKLELKKNEKSSSLNCIYDILIAI